MEFTKYPKTPRLFRDCVITEKIDGTNAAIVIESKSREEFNNRGEDWNTGGIVTVTHSEEPDVAYLVGAQSRNRLITPNSDNAGFAKWVFENADALVRLLGEGVHFGEWWGKGIQRGYGLDHKRFSLFNTGRWNFSGLHTDATVKKLVYPEGLDVVPVLYRGPFSTEGVSKTLEALRVAGSPAAWNAQAVSFDRPEGVVVYHTASGQVFKALIENDDKPKGLS